MSNTVESKKRGFFGFIIYFIVKIKEDDIFALGAQLAYYLILSFFIFDIFMNQQQKDYVIIIIMINFLIKSSFFIIVIKNATNFIEIRV